jgi:hypothetical protein
VRTSSGLPRTRVGAAKAIKAAAARRYDRDANSSIELTFVSVGATVAYLATSVLLHWWSPQMHSFMTAAGISSLALVLGLLIITLTLIAVMILSTLAGARRHGGLKAASHRTAPHRRWRWTCSVHATATDAHRQRTCS